MPTQPRADRKANREIRASRLSETRAGTKDDLGRRIQPLPPTGPDIIAEVVTAFAVNQVHNFNTTVRAVAAGISVFLVHAGPDASFDIPILNECIIRYQGGRRTFWYHVAGGSIRQSGGTLNGQNIFMALGKASGVGPTTSLLGTKQIQAHRFLNAYQNFGYSGIVTLEDDDYIAPMFYNFGSTRTYEYNSSLSLTVRSIRNVQETA